MLSRLLLIILIVLNLYILATVDNSTRGNIVQTVYDIPQYVSNVVDIVKGIER